MKLHELFEAEERSVKSILSILGKQPKKIKRDFICSSMRLTSLEGSPKEVGGAFLCSSNKLTSLEGISPIIRLQLSCIANKLTSLHNIHKQIKHIGGRANFTFNPIKSHVLGLLLIDGLKNVLFSNKKVEAIINKHLAADRDVFACQEELIEAGLEEFAQL